MSHDRFLRIGALRILVACDAAQTPDGLNTDEPRKDIRTVLQLCLAAEGISLDVAGVRERILKIRRVSAMASNDIDSNAVRLAFRWLLGM